jgi:hypothetical protein
VAQHLTRRFRAENDSALLYNITVAIVVSYMREHPDDFVLGPLDSGKMVDHGLWVSGPDLEGVSDAITRVPGLSEVDA